MTSFHHLVLGTRNRKKRQELIELLANHPIDVRTLDDYPQSVTVEETGRTFAENARQKAVSQSSALGQWVLAEDSGLMVDALNGAPGVLSARFAGAQARDPDNNARLLELLRDVPQLQRTAQYVCHVVLADPDARIRFECEETCHGRIRNTPLGDSGFGYDPLFEIAEYHRTFAQLGEHVKAMISHRGRALRILVPRLPDLLDGESTFRVNQRSG